MVGTEPPETSAPAPKQDPESLVLRGRPPAPIRFRRGLIIASVGTVVAALIGITWLALDPRYARIAGSSDQTLEPGRISEDALAGVPASYADVPRLGPPLPGDLGKPVLDHQADAAGFRRESEASVSEDRRMDAEQEQLASEAEAARRSAVLVSLGGGPAHVSVPDGPAEVTTADDASDQGPAPASTGLGKNEPAAPSPQPIEANMITNVQARWTLSAGTVISASLLTGLNSDLPGTVIAQVTENVRDSATGSTILIPQGARLIGKYDSAVGFGQSRARLVWERLVFPNGASLTLGAIPASDGAGYAGLSDRVNGHEWRLVKGIALSTLLGIGTEVSLGSSESELVRAVRESTQQNAGRAGDQIVSRRLDVKPALTVRPGWPVLAIVQSDLVLAPWKG